MKLSEMAAVIRSKNAGPFELTFDIIMPDRKSFELLNESNIINSESIARMYGINKEDVLNVITFEPANAIKFTIVRPVGSGALGDTDIYGAQQHAPLLEIDVPGESS